MGGFDAARDGGNLLPRDGSATLLERAFTPAEADELLADLLASLALRQEYIRLMGRTIPLPRLTGWYGDEGYAYSGVDHPPADWPPALGRVRSRVEALVGTTFEGVLANLYRDGRDSVAWHADDEPSLGQGAAGRPRPAARLLPHHGIRRAALLAPRGAEDAPTGGVAAQPDLSRAGRG
jgi:hypothetical protein